MTDRTVVYRLQADVQQFRAQVTAAGASLKDLGDKATAADKSGQKFRLGLDSLGGAAGKIGLVAAAGLGAAVKKAADFDSAMSSVQAATHESATAMESLRAAALKAGADTAFSATEAAAGIENLAKAGVSTADILNGGLAGALDLAAAGEMEVADAAEAAAGAMAQFKLEGDQVPHIADLLAAAAGKAQGEVSDMVMALKQGGTVAAQTGLSIEETAGAFAAMAEQSLLGSDAGTSFKTMLAALTPNSKKAADAMAAYNIQAFDAEGKFVGMTALAGQLQSGLKDLTDEQRAMALETIFGSDAVRAASIIYDNGAEGIANWTAKVNDAGYAAETAETKLDNLKGDLEALGGSLETALIGTGSGSQGALRSLTQNLTSAVNAYNDLPQGAKNAAAALLTTSAAVGGSIWVGAKLVGGISSTREALQNLGLSGPAASKAMKSVAAAAAGLAVLTTAAAAVRSLQEATDESLPGMEALEGRLIALAETPDDFSFSLGSEFDSLADSIDRLTDPSKADAFADTMQTPFEGLFGEAGSLRVAKAEIDSLDQALAGLATSGNAEVAARALENLADQYGLSEAQVKGLMSSLPQYSEALAGQENDAKLAGAAQADLASSTRGAGDAFSDAAEQAEDFGDTIDGLNERLAGRANMRDYEAALDDFTKSLKDNGKTFDINTEKGRNNQAALDNIASSALEVAENMGKAQRQKFLTNAIEDIRTMGKSMGLPKSEIESLIELLRTANKTDVKPSINADASAALTAIERVRAALANIKDKSVTVRVTQTGAAVTPGFGPVREADGGFISGPGTATSDSIPAYLSNGEYVIKAAAVDKYGIHMFDRLNAMHFAEGGSTDRKKRRRRSTVEFDSVVDNSPSEQALAQAADAAAQFYAEQERAQREIDERAAAAATAAEAAAQRQREIDEAIFAGQQRAWDQATDAAQAQVDAAKAMVDSVQANMDRIGQAATAGFAGSWFSGGDQRHGLWTGPGGGAAGDWRTRAQQSISGLQERGALISQLSSLGLGGAALEDLLGNQSNAGIAEMIGAGEIDDFAALFAQRQALLASVGAQAGQAGYGADMAAANAQFAALNAQFAALTAAIEAARPITVIQRTTEQAAAMELARILSRTGGA